MDDPTAPGQPDLVAPSPTANAAAPDAQAADPRVPALPLVDAPGIAWFAFAAVAVDWVLRRAIVPSMGDNIARAARESLRVPLTFIELLAATTSMFTLLVCLVALLRAQKLVGIVLRVGLALFGGLYFAYVYLAITGGDTNQRFAGLMGATGGYLLSSVLAMVGLRPTLAARRRGPVGLRTGMGLLMLSAFLALAALFLDAPGILGGRNEQLGVMSAQVKSLAQPVWLAAPLIASVSFLPSDPTKRLRTLWAGLVVALVLLGGYFTWSLVHGEAFEAIWYTATRLGPATLDLGWLYPLGVAIAATALVVSDRSTRQGALGAMLLLLAAFMPRSATMLMVHLAGLALMARAAVTLRAPI